jgi:hypothetical protein
MIPPLGPPLNLPRHVAKSAVPGIVLLLVLARADVKEPRR